MCGDCLCVGGEVENDVVWWIDFCFWFGIVLWSVEGYVGFGWRRDDDGDCDLWNWFCWESSFVVDFYW